MSGSGNGTDMSTLVTMVQNVLSGQQDMRAEMHGMRAELRAEIQSLRDEHGRKIDEVAGQVSDLRQAVTEYHASVLGHGVLISQLEDRVRRIERHLNLSPAA